MGTGYPWGPQENQAVIREEAAPGVSLRSLVTCSAEPNKASGGDAPAVGFREE